VRIARDARSGPLVGGSGVGGPGFAFARAGLRYAPMVHSFVRFLFRRPRLTFALMGGFFLLFGLTSVNLFVLLKLNLDLFFEYGLMVIADGALQQLIELLGSAYLSMVFYVLFRVCERVLVERVTAKRFGPRRGRSTPRA
jgi:hypothetical protein